MTTIHLKVSNDFRGIGKRLPRTSRAKALLNNQTIFIQGPRRSFGSYYQLAKNHNKVCHTRRGKLNSLNKEGTFVWFEDTVSTN